LDRGAWAESELGAAAANGWTLKYHIHSHPFFFSPEGAYLPDSGMVIPSGEAHPDPGSTGAWGNLPSWKAWRAQLGLKQVVITNGFDSLEFSATEIEKFP
jgi:hypothetical protein